MTRLYQLPLLLLATPLWAEPACTLAGFTKPTAPGSPVVFDAPMATANRLGVVPRTEDPDYGVMGGNFLIDEVQGEYAHITNVLAWYSSDETGPDGWILAADIAFTVQATKGYAAPDRASQVIYTGKDWIYPDQINTLLGCKDDWAHLSFSDAAGEQTAWLRGVCSGQETTCDGVDGDK